MMTSGSQQCPLSCLYVRCLKYNENKIIRLLPTLKHILILLNMSKIKYEFKKITYGTKNTLVLPKSSFMNKGGYFG